MGYSCIIVDDEVHQLEHLTRLLQTYFPSYRLLTTASSAEKGAEQIRLLQPDLVFLDVVMPPETGFDLLEKIPSRGFDVIFCTSFDKYAIHAFKVSAVDYLLKPFGVEELRMALRKFEEKKLIEQRLNHVELLLENRRKNGMEHDRVALPTQNGFMSVEVKDIVRCEADNMYTTFYFTNKSTFIVSKNMKECEEILAEYDFIRIHTSHLVNLRHVKEYLRGDGGRVIMADGSQVEVSRRKKEDFVRAFRKI